MDQPKKIKKPRGKARLLEGKCIACGARCQASCPVDAIEMNAKEEPMILNEKCIGCQKCIKVCPGSALELYFTPEEQKILDEIAKQGGSAAAHEEEESKPVRVAVTGAAGQIGSVLCFMIAQGRMFGPF